MYQCHSTIGPISHQVKSPSPPSRQAWTEDRYRLCYVRGAEGIIVALADTTDGGVPMEADAVRVLVTRFYAELWNAWDDSAVETVLADDFVFRGSLGTETTGWDGWRTYRDAVRQAAPDFRNDLVDLVCEGDRAAARLVCSGHHRGLLLGLPGSGHPFRYDVTAFFRGRNGHLAEAWVLGDLQGLRRQLMQP
jgi:steroid delta-isomerase-like uncharacterized protein